MAIRSNDEILSMLKGRLGEDTSDDALGIIEDVSDTLSDYTSRLKDSTDWKAKYESNDAEWRKKYRDRFFEGSSPNDDKDSDEPDDKPLTYENLFKFEKG